MFPRFVHEFVINFIGVTLQDLKSLPKVLYAIFIELLKGFLVVTLDTNATQPILHLFLPLALDHQPSTKVQDRVKAGEVMGIVIHRKDQK
jgi:hypothetical protein